MRGRDLRAMRKQARISQQELRAVLEWDSRKLPWIENEEVVPTPEDLELIILKINELRQSRQAELAPA
jgi:hypothetical protein